MVQIGFHAEDLIKASSHAVWPGALESLPCHQKTVRKTPWRSARLTNRKPKHAPTTKPAKDAGRTSIFGYRVFEASDAVTGVRASIWTHRGGQTFVCVSDGQTSDIVLFNYRYEAEVFARTITTAS